MSLANHKIRVMCTGNATIRVGEVAPGSKEFLGGSVDVTNDVMHAIGDLIGYDQVRVVYRGDMPAYEIGVRRVRATK